MISILWADDQPDVARSFTSYLKLEGCVFDYASSGNEALAKISTNSYDLVLVDLAMPPDRWGGLWLLERIVELNIDIVSIVVSGEGTQFETIKALRLGAADYVTKDKLLAELPAQISSSLNVQTKARKRVIELIRSGESHNVEFKSTLRMNLRSQKKDSELELAVFKTIAGFLNTVGGQLLVGVTDAGEIFGLQEDGFINDDKFHLHFWNIFKESLGIELVQFVKTGLVDIGGKSIFHVVCSKSDRPIFLRWKSAGEGRYQELFYVRVGPQTDLLGVRQALAYIEGHFPANRS